MSGPMNEVDADTEAPDDLLYTAWGLIANSCGGNWDEADKASPGWKAAAERWRDAWHATLGEATSDCAGREKLADALRLTVEYVGLETLHPVEGWSWYDALRCEPWFDGWMASMAAAAGTLTIDAAPTVDVPQPLTCDGVLAAVKAIEDAGDKAVVETLPPFTGRWVAVSLTWIKGWANPDVPRWNVRVRAVEVETEQVPLTQLVGRTIKGETLPVYNVARYPHSGEWCWWAKNTPSRPLPVDLATGLVTVVKGEA